MLDISDWNYQQQEVLSLQGNWGFYFNNLYTWKEISKSEIQPDLFPLIPSRWTDYQIGGEPIIRDGVATYHLQVFAPGYAGKSMGISSNSFPSASKILINDLEIFEAGQIATDKENETPQFTHKTAYFTVPSENFDIIIHISNYHYAHPGLWTNIYLGSQNSIINFSQNRLIKEAILIGAVFTLCIVYLIHFLSEQDIRKHLYFALICLLIILQIDYDGQLIIYDLMPHENFQIWILLSSLPIWLPYFVLLYLRETFAISKYQKVIHVILGITILQTLCYILLPTQISTAFNNYYNLISFMIIIFAVYMIYPALKIHPKTSTLYIFSLCILILAFFYDYFLYYRGIVDIYIGSLMPSAFVFMVIIQAIILTFDYSKLQDAKQQALQRETSSQLAFLQAQIKPHFLYNALSAIENVCYSDGERAGELITSLSLYLRSSFDFNNLNKFTNLENELNFIRHYIQIEQERFGDRVKYIEEIQAPLHTEIPVLILEPLIENAIQHGITSTVKGGTIKLSISTLEQGTRFCVEDDGIGFDKTTLQNLFTEKNEKNSIGLRNISQRLKTIYGKDFPLTIQSIEGQGTKIHFVLPNIKVEKK